MPKYYPVMLDVRGRLAIVVGGDRVAAEKAAALSASGAHVSVINPAFCDELLMQAEYKRVTLHRKTYEPGDLEGAFVVVAATNDSKLVEAIWTETQKSGQLVNIVDIPERCSFIMPSILRRDQLTIAVSTEGASPGLAKRIRQNLEEIFPLAYGTYLRLAALARTHLRKNGVSYERRDDFFSHFFTSDVLARLIEENVTQATVITAELLRHYDIDVSASVLEASLEEEKKYVNSDA
jgi:precorrin-2 dehydrogenase/sirohydrochlorin ferrochelatase